MKISINEVVSSAMTTLLLYSGFYMDVGWAKYIGMVLVWINISFATLGIILLTFFLSVETSRFIQKKNAIQDEIGGINFSRCISIMLTVLSILILFEFDHPTMATLWAMILLIVNSLGKTAKNKAKWIRDNVTED